MGQTVVLTVALATSNVLAQEKEEFALPTAVVRDRRSGYVTTQSGLSKLPVPLLDIPQSITVVPQELMQEQAVTSLREGLRNVTGIGLAAGEGGGAQGDSLTLRGYNARNDLFLDGLRDQGSYTRDIFNLEAIEVLKGPASVFFGRGSTGGIINQISKLPRLETFYSASLSAGDGPLWRGTADINQQLSATSAFRVNLLAHQQDVVDRDEIEVRRFGFAPSIAFGLGTATQFTASYLVQSEDNVPDYGVPFLFGKPAPVPRETFYGLTKDDEEETLLNVFTLRLDHRFSDQLSLRNTLRYSHTDREATPSPPRIAGNPTPDTPLSAIVVTRNHPGRDTDEGILINQTELNARFVALGVKHTLISGLEFGWETFDATRFANAGVPPAPLLNPDPTPDTFSITRTISAITDTTAFSLGIYAVDQVKISRHFELQGGVRWDLFDAEFSSDLDNLHFERTDKMWSYRAGIVFHPIPTHSYYFSYGTSFNPSAEALALAQNNVNTPPEENESFEFGAKVDLLGGALRLQAAVFRLDKTNARTTDPITGLMVLEGEQRVQGVEFGVAGRFLPRWNLFAGYTYLDSELLKALDAPGAVPTQGNELANTPKHSMNFWTTYDIGERWQVGTGVTYGGERFSNVQNTNVVPDYVFWDATVAYQLNKNMQLRLNVQNITDELYYTNVHPQHVVPGSGRTFIMTGNFRF
jgi:catecholate siderophore receptor